MSDATAGFNRLTRLDTARERLCERLTPTDHRRRAGSKWPTNACSPRAPEARAGVFDPPEELRSSEPSFALGSRRQIFANPLASEARRERSERLEANGEERPVSERSERATVVK
jgi:hypothetical protein